MTVLEMTINIGFRSWSLAVGNYSHSQEIQISGFVRNELL
jgi:hypothetical protein